MSGGILLIGDGGHCASVLDLVISSRKFSKIGIVSHVLGPGEIMGVPVVGCDKELPALRLSGWENAFVALGSVGNTDNRERLYRLLSELGFTLPNLIDTTAAVSNFSVLAGGVFVGKNAVVNAGVHVGCCAILNTGCIVEHHCQVGAFAHIATGAVLCGQVSVGDGTHIGANSVVRQGVKIGRHTMIGMGSVVIREVADGATAFGNPCKERG